MIRTDGKPTIASPAPRAVDEERRNQLRLVTLNAPRALARRQELYGNRIAAERLEYLRGELRAERISYGELIELQELAQYIEEGDVELLEAAGVPEFDSVEYAADEDPIEEGDR